MLISIHITEATPQEAARIFNSLIGKSENSDVVAHSLNELDVRCFGNDEPVVTCSPIQHNEPVVTSFTSNEVDADGFPWDARIHAGTKSKKKDGRWTTRRGLDDLTLKSVESELLMKSPAPAPLANPAEMFSPVNLTQPVQQFATIVEKKEVTFESFMKSLGAGFATRILLPSDISDLVQQISLRFNENINAITDIASNKEMINFANDTLVSLGKIEA